MFYLIVALNSRRLGKLTLAKDVIHNFYCILAFPAVYIVGRPSPTQGNFVSSRIGSQLLGRYEHTWFKQVIVFNE